MQNFHPFFCWERYCCQVQPLLMNRSSRPMAMTVTPTLAVLFFVYLA